jgi:hypothetical protein
MKQILAQYRLSGLVFYTWEGSIHDLNYAHDPYSAFICGTLTPSGNVAIASM